MPEVESIEAKFNELYEKHRGFIRCTVLRDLGDGTPDFEDVIGDIYLAVWKMLVIKSFRKECKFRTLLYRVVRNHVIDLIRWRVKTKRIGINSVVFGYGYIDDFEKRFEEKELLRLHEKEKLKPRKRKKRVCEFERNNYDESKPTVELPWRDYILYPFKPF